MSENLYFLPQGWEWKKLEDITSKTKNKNPLSEPEKYFTYIDISSIDNCFFEIKEPKYLIGNEAPSRAKKEVEKGDILFATTRPNLKNIAMVEKDFENPIASTGFCILRGDKKIENKYLFYFLFTKNLSEQVESKIRGAQYPAIADKDLMNCTIPLPPLEEQKRIVGVLDGLFGKIDKSIALLDESIASASSLIPSALNEVFEELGEKWKKKKINEFIIKTKTKNPLSEADKYFTYIDISSIDNIHYEIITPKYLIGKDAPSRAKKEVFINDIIFATTRPNLKNIAIVNCEYENPIASTGFCVLRVNSNISNKFLFYYLISDDLQNKIADKIRGAQYPAISDKDLCDCKLPLPPLDIQTQTVAYLDALHVKADALKKAQEKKKEELLALKASLLELAFKGAL